MLADVSNAEVVIPGTEVNSADDMTGDLDVEQASVLYVSGEESIQQVSLHCTTWQEHTPLKPRAEHLGWAFVAKDCILYE